jgi:autotransporter-associated beta strand protein
MTAKTRRATRYSACSIALACLTTRTFVDAAIYWDTNGATPGAGVTPSGTWDNVTSNWSSDINGTSPTQLWSSGEVAVFSASGSGPIAYTVLVSGTQFASGLSFTPSATTLVGGEVNLASPAAITVSPSSSAALRLVLSGNSGLLVNVSGLLNLASANTYTGATSISGSGSVGLQNSAALGSSSGVSVAAGSALLLDGSNLNVPTPITSLRGIGPGTVTSALRNLANNNTYSGNITLGSDARITSDAGTLTLSGNINGSGLLTVAGNGSGSVSITGAIQTGTNGLSRTGSGLLTLSGNNTNTGPYTIAGGGLKLAGASERIANTVPLSITQGATFDMAGFSETLGSIAGTGRIITGGGTLTVGADNTATTFSGSLFGSGALNKVGSGTLSLTVSNSDFTGVATVTGGVLAVRIGSLGSTFAGTIVAGDGSVDILSNTVVTEPFTLNGNGFASGGALRKTSSDNSTYSGSITLAGQSRIHAETPGTLFVSAPINTAGFNLTLGGSGSGIYSGAITGGGELIKVGSGTATLTSSGNSYAGSTTVVAGKLLINSPGTIASPVTVNSGATLGGTGTINGSVTVNPGGHLAPGASPGTLTLGGDLTLASQAALAFELGDPGGSDKIAMTTSILHLNGQQFSDFTFTPVTGFAPGQFYTLIMARGIDGNLGPNVSGMIGTTPAYLVISENHLVLATPEPGNLLLAAAGFSVNAALRRRRRRRLYSLPQGERRPEFTPVRGPERCGSGDKSECSVVAHTSDAAARGICRLPGLSPGR